MVAFSLHSMKLFPAHFADASNLSPHTGENELMQENLSKPVKASEIFRRMWVGLRTRRTWTTTACVRLVFAFVVLTFFSWAGIMLSHQSAGVATIWFSNGMLLGLLITRAPEEWLAYFALGLTADVVADLIYGDPFAVAIGVSAANSIEVVGSALLLTLLFGVPLNLSKLRPLIGFLFVSVVGMAAFTSALGASWTLLFYPGEPWWRMFRTWYLGDMLGMAILAPTVFMLQRAGFFSLLERRHLAHTLLVLLVPVATGVVVFTHSHDPLIFLLFPALLLVVFRLGFPGTVITIFILAFIAIAFTVTGHGPLMLIVGDHMKLHRIVVAQIFIAVAIFSTFPIATLLEDREALRESLAESEARQRHLANADDLTGLMNRRAFNLHLHEQWEHALKMQAPLALVLLDADFFKRYNDCYGHLKGDDCLRVIANVIAETATDYGGVAARYGGEEFAVILPGHDAERAGEHAERIREALTELGLPHEYSPFGMQTVSLGVASLVPEASDHSKDLFAIADAALYEAKGRGRNCVVVGDDSMLPTDAEKSVADQGGLR
jgi:diguanylate cyclase (GGDEF)-like protein